MRSHFLFNTMSKTEKELAYLHGLYVDNEWIPRFSDLFDKHYKSSSEETFLYLNSGVGTHAISLREKLDKDTQLFAVCETKEFQKIAQAKVEATKADVDFSTSKPYAESDFVLVDSSLVKHAYLKNFLSDSFALSKNKISFFVATAGSYGEIFSYLWEVLNESDLSEKTGEIEKLIKALPTVSDVKDMAKTLGVANVTAETKNEIFEFETGKDFIESPLIKYFLSQFWLEFLEPKEKEQVLKNLALKIDDELERLSFRFSIKATVIFGEKS